MDRNNAFYEFFHNTERIGIETPKNEDFMDLFFETCKIEPLGILGCLSYHTYNFISTRIKELKKIKKYPGKDIKLTSKPQLEVFYSSDYSFLVEYNLYDYETDTFDPRVLEIVEKLNRKFKKDAINFQLAMYEVQRSLMYYYGYVEIDEFIEKLKKYDIFLDTTEDFIISVLDFNILFFHENYRSGNILISYYIKDLQGFLELRELYDDLDYKPVPLEHVFDNPFQIMTVINDETHEMIDLTGNFMTLPEPFKDVEYLLNEHEKAIFESYNLIVPKFYYKGYSIKEVDEYFSGRINGKLN